MDLGHPVLATAGYNAGPGRARRWRAETPLEGAIYAESIPFNETRDYVKKVMTNAWFYARQMGSSKVSLKEMMGNVPSRGGVGAASEIVKISSEPATTALSSIPRTE
jgi:soluble lytic murein transglycosylase